MKVSKKEDFAILIMTVLARNRSSRFLPVSFISQKTGLSPLFLKHIAVELKNNGLINSREGAGGGYRLSRKADKITAKQILDAVGSSDVTPSCDTKSCRLKKDNCTCYTFWGGINRKMSEVLSRVTLSRIANI